MHSKRVGFADLPAGAAIGPFRVTVSPAANDRYWQAAGVDHPSLRAGHLYPPIAANLTILAFQQHCPDPVIQTRQYLRCHRAQTAGVELVVTGTVGARYEKRGRTYIDVATTIATADRAEAPLWTSEVTFTPAATLGAGP